MAHAVVGADPAHADSGSSFSFGAAGDFGASSNVTATLSAMGSSNLNFAIALGDLSYDQVAPETAWCSYVHQNIGSLPMELVSGNHEDGGEISQGLIQSFAACMPNQMSGMVGTYGEQYYFDYPASAPIARFIMISPGLSFSDGDAYNYSQGGAAYNWVSNAIDAARAQGIKWIIVGMHKVCLSDGGSACDVGTDILNLLISKHVDLVIDGHDHSYQRSKQLDINGSTCTGLTPAAYNSNCVVNDGSSGVYTAGAGTVIVTSGTGGVDDEFGAIYNNPDSPYFATVSGNNINPQKGFVKYTVSTSGIRAQFVASTHTSNFTDAFTIAGPNSLSTPTPTVGPGATPVMSDNFDSQPAGSLQVGSSATQFTSQSGAANLAVVNTVSNSAPNSLAVATKPGGGVYASDQYTGAGYTAHTLQFSVELGSDFNLPSSDYMVLAQTLPMGAASEDGKVSLVLTGTGNLYVDYFDSTGVQHFLWNGGALTPGEWHTIDLQETVGVGTGSLAEYLDGHPEISAPLIDTGYQAVGWFAVGDEYAPSDAAIAGHLYIDDVTTIPSVGFPAAPTFPSPTPGPAGSPMLIDSISFDNQDVGALQTGFSPWQLSGQVNGANLSVQTTNVDSPPNALAVNVAGGGSSFGYEQYAAPGYANHTLQFNVEFGSDFVLPASDYLVLAQTTPLGAAGSSNGHVSLVMAGGGDTLHLDYFDSTGIQHSLWSSASLSTGMWHSIALQDVVGSGAGSLALSVDGKAVISAQGLNTGSSPVGYFAVGDEYSPTDANTMGHLYIDDIKTMSSVSPATPTPTPVTPTPTPTSVTPTPTSVTPTPTSVTPTPTSVTPTPTSVTPTPTSVTPTPTFVTPTPTGATPTPTSVTPTPTATQTGALFSNNFDGQPVGPLQTGSQQNQFTQISGTGAPTVQNAVSQSAPNSLRIAIGGQNTRVTKTYTSGYASQTLDFSAELAGYAPRWPNASLVIAQTRLPGSTDDGSADVELIGDGRVALGYISSGQYTVVSTGLTMINGSWHRFELKETAGSTGSVSLSMDGVVIARQSAVNTGTGLINGFALGEMLPHQLRRSSVTLYIDDVHTSAP